MKEKEKNQARLLRKQEGRSINEICKILKVSKSSVSLWVRDIKLTNKQIKNLDKRANKHRQCFYDERIKYYQNIRLSYQEKGRQLALRKKTNEEFIAGCMLYWAEGSKDKNSMRFCNSDPNMIKFFIKFLINNFNIKKSDIKILCNFYDDIYSKNDIEAFWEKCTGISKKNFYKSIINYKNKYSKRKGYCPYGTCNLTINNTELVQCIFGAIKEIAKINDKELWLK